MRPTTAPAISSSLTATLPASRMTPAEAGKLVDDLHRHLKPIDEDPTRFSMSSNHAPSTLQRRQLTAVAERLERDLAQLGALDEREYAIGRFLLGYEKGKGSELNAGLLNEEFLEAVAGQPLSAIMEACTRFRQGKALLPADRGWRPTPAQFALEVAEGLVPARKRLLHVRRILAAEVYTPPMEEQKAAVHEATRKFLEDRRMAREAERQAPGREDRFELEFSAALDGLKAAGRHMDVARLMPGARQREVSK